MRRVRPVLTDYLQLTAGVILVAASLNLFLVPNRITPGGFSGLATLLHYAVGVPVGTGVAILNIPLFIIGFKKLGTAFVIRSAYGTLLLSLLVDVFVVPPATTDFFLAALYGGALLGVGLGLALRGGGSTGGSDMFARIMHAYKAKIGVGTFIIIFDFFIVVGAGILFSPELAMYALAILYGSSKVVDLVLEGSVSSRACFIISDRAKEVADEILHDLERGVTLFKAQGMYTGDTRMVLLCVVQSAGEMHALREVVRTLDPEAFIFVTAASEVLGQGFGKLTD
ncbi:MAG: YitT family protein [Bacillota bacterium]